MMRLLFIAVLALGLAAPAAGALAHHGWSWTTGGNIDLTGIIKTVRLGNPHGILKIDVEGEEWTAEVGQPWRNRRAGLKDGDLAEGVEIRVIGEPAADLSEGGSRWNGCSWANGSTSFTPSAIETLEALFAALEGTGPWRRPCGAPAGAMPPSTPRTSSQSPC